MHPTRIFTKAKGLTNQAIAMGQNWEELLKGIISIKSETGLENWDRYYDNEKIYEVTGLEIGEIGSAKEFLVEQGLISFEKLDDGTRRVVVEDDGFNIAREQEFRDDQKTSSKIMAMFTIILGTSAALSLAVNVVDSSVKDQVLIWNSAIVVGTLVAVLWLVNRNEFFDDL